jgi:hypothetical protein
VNLPAFALMLISGILVFMESDVLC